MHHDSHASTGVHADLLSCMNRVYLRGCEAAYLEPLLGTEGFDYCPKPAATHGRRLSNDNYGRRDAGTETTSFINGVSSRVTKEASESLLAAARAGPGAAPPSGIKQADHLSDDRSHDRRHSSGSDMIAVESDRRERRSNRVRSKDKRAARTVDDAVLGGRRRLGEAEHGGGEILANGEGHPSLKSPHLVENVGLHSGMSSTREPGSAGSLVIHIRSGDIFLNEVLERSRADFLGYGQVCDKYPTYHDAREAHSSSFCPLNAVGRWPRSRVWEAGRFYEAGGSLSLTLRVHRAPGQILERVRSC